MIFIRVAVARVGHYTRPLQHVPRPTSPGPLQQIRLSLRSPFEFCVQRVQLVAKAKVQALEEYNHVVLCCPHCADNLGSHI